MEEINENPTANKECALMVFNIFDENVLEEFKSHLRFVEENEKFKIYLLQKSFSPNFIKKDNEIFVWICEHEENGKKIYTISISTDKPILYDIIRVISSNTPFHKYHVLIQLYEDEDDENPVERKFVMFNGHYYKNDDMPDDILDLLFAQDLIKKENYQEALKTLNSLKILESEEVEFYKARCYMEMGQYEIAKEMFDKQDAISSKINIFKMYFNNNISFNYQSYTKCMDYLKEQNNQYGYLAEFILYSKEEYNNIDGSKAIKALEEGIRQCRSNVVLIYYYADCLEKGIFIDKDEIKSHQLFESINEDEDGSYRYAEDLFWGIGCTMDKNKAIDYLIKSANMNNDDAVITLINIYKGDKGFVDKEKAQYWENKFKA